MEKLVLSRPEYELLPKEVRRLLVSLNGQAFTVARKHGAVETVLTVKLPDGSEWHDHCRVAPRIEAKSG